LSQKQKSKGEKRNKPKHALRGMSVQVDYLYTDEVNH